MTTPPTNPDAEELVEKLAAIEHERWADWQKWMHDKKVYAYACDACADQASIFRVPVEDMHRWNKQIETPYAELSEQEKRSDRDQVMRYWPLLSRYIQKERQKAVEDFVAFLDEWPLAEPLLGSPRQHVYARAKDYFTHQKESLEKEK